MTFSNLELDLLVRGLFALQNHSPQEEKEIQRLLDRFVRLEYSVQGIYYEFKQELHT